MTQPETDAKTRPRTTGAHWPVIIIGLLVANALAMLLMVMLAHKDASHHVEVDYYRKALQWDSKMEQARENRRLGWRVEATLEPTREGALVLATVADNDGAAVAGAQVTVRAFHRARAARVVSLHLVDTENTGRYTGAFKGARAGLWQVETVVRARGAVFTDAALVELKRRLTPTKWAAKEPSRR